MWMTDTHILKYETIDKDMHNTWEGMKVNNSQIINLPLKRESAVRILEYDLSINAGNFSGTHH